MALIYRTILLDSVRLLWHKNKPNRGHFGGFSGRGLSQRIDANPSLLHCCCSAVRCTAAAVLLKTIPVAATVLLPYSRDNWYTPTLASHGKSGSPPHSGLHRNATCKSILNCFGSDDDRTQYCCVVRIFSDEVWCGT